MLRERNTIELGINYLDREKTTNESTKSVKKTILN
jgi:hypothetical protein